MFVGHNPVTAVYVGDQAASAVYVGDTLAWSSGPDLGPAVYTGRWTYRRGFSPPDPSAGECSTGTFDNRLLVFGRGADLDGGYIPGMYDPDGGGAVDRRRDMFYTYPGGVIELIRNSDGATMVADIIDATNPYNVLIYTASSIHDSTWNGDEITVNVYPYLQPPFRWGDDYHADRLADISSKDFSVYGIDTGPGAGAVRLGGTDAAGQSRGDAPVGLRFVFREITLSASNPTVELWDGGVWTPDATQHNGVANSVWVNRPPNSGRGYLEGWVEWGTVGRR